MKPDVNKFRLKGDEILKKETTRPRSIDSFLNDQNQAQALSIAQKHKIPETQKYIGAKTQRHNDKIAQISRSEAPGDGVERIHVQIRKDLADRLIQMVYSRKLSKKRTSQRSIIEQALEEFFDKHNS
jgi:hypothetical protein